MSAKRARFCKWRTFVNLRLFTEGNLGKITGVPDYVRLSVLTDYTGETLPHDQVYIFDGASKRPSTLHFKHEGKKITFTTTGEKEKERLEFTWTR